MLIEVVHINGDMEDIHHGYHKAALYEEFILTLRAKVKRAYAVGATIIYRPNLGLMPREQTEVYLTPENDSRTRVGELKEQFPFLNGLEEISFTLLPDGLYAPGYEGEIDGLIAKENSGLVIVGGKYKSACVATVARNIAARNPHVQVFIGEDISFHNDFPPEKFFHHIPQTSLEQRLRKS